MAYLFPQARGESKQSQNTQAFAHSWKRSYLNNSDFDVTNQWICALSSFAVPPSSSATPSYCSPAPLWEGGGSFLNPTVRSNSTANQCLVSFSGSCVGVESLGTRLLTVSFLFIWQQHSLCPLVIVHNRCSKLAVQSTSCSFVIFQLQIHLTRIQNGNSTAHSTHQCFFPAPWLAHTCHSAPANDPTSCTTEWNANTFDFRWQCIWEDMEVPQLATAHS